ncbi:myeloid cell surface antigen CD33-like [Phyllobates terribilis]|uniref:myeloid cell surface antigen CD33-like n=1 Tax=Phyllobates terribilis TaxID=111132 RepID=UPI003CCA73B0
MWVSLVVILPLLWKSITCQLAGYSIRVSRNVGVQEGLCVTIPCTFIADSRNTFSNSSGYWIQIKEFLSPYYIVATNNKSSDVNKTNFHLTGNPYTGDCTLTITDARKGDEGGYYFRFEESKNSAVRYNYHVKSTTTITVTDLTDEPVISDFGTMIAGINKTLTCAPPGNCPATNLTFQWKKSNVDGVWKENSSTVTFIPSTDDHQENITCEMTNTKGNTTRKTIFLDVYSPPGNKGITGQSSEAKYRDIAIAFICGMIITTIFVLLYKLITRKKMGKKKNYVRAKEPSERTEPPANEKSGHNAEEAPDNNTELDPSGVPSKGDLNYSTVAFTPKPSKVKSSQPESEYAEIKGKKKLRQGRCTLIASLINLHMLNREESMCPLHKTLTGAFLTSHSTTKGINMKSLLCRHHISCSSGKFCKQFKKLLYSSHTEFWSDLHGAQAEVLILCIAEPLGKSTFLPDIKTEQSISLAWTLKVSVLSGLRPCLVQLVLAESTLLSHAQRTP